VMVPVRLHYRRGNIIYIGHTCHPPSAGVAVPSILHQPRSAVVRSARRRSGSLVRVRRSALDQGRASGQDGQQARQQAVGNGPVECGQDARVRADAQGGSPGPGPRPTSSSTVDSRNALASRGSGGPGDEVVAADAGLVEVVVGVGRWCRQASAQRIQRHDPQ